MTAATPAQREMLRLAARVSGEWELGQLVMECAGGYIGDMNGALAWRTADRTAGALLRRGWLALDGDIVLITPAGDAARRTEVP